jgi:hypothetical protein
VTTRALAIAGFAVALLAVVLAVVAIVVVRSDNGSGTRVPVPVFTLAPTPATPTPVRVLDGGAVARFIESDGRYQNVICPDEPVRKGHDLHVYWRSRARPKRIEQRAFHGDDHQRQRRLHVGPGLSDDDPNALDLTRRGRLHVSPPRSLSFPCQKRWMISPERVSRALEPSIYAGSSGFCRWVPS